MVPRIGEQQHHAAHGAVALLPARLAARGPAHRPRASRPRSAHVGLGRRWPRPKLDSPSTRPPAAPRRAPLRDIADPRGRVSGTERVAPAGPRPARPGRPGRPAPIAQGRLHPAPARLGRSIHSAIGRDRSAQPGPSRGAGHVRSPRSSSLGRDEPPPLRASPGGRSGGRGPFRECVVPDVSARPAWWADALTACLSACPRNAGPAPCVARGPRRGRRWIRQQGRSSREVP